MKYLCLCYYDTDAFANLNSSDEQAIAAACQPHEAALKATGKLVTQGSLSSPDSWTHFVPRNGKPSLVQGPYIKSSRQAGAFFVIEAKTFEEAQRVASRHAAANFGEHLGFAVEVRACEMYDTYEVGNRGLAI
ncbi:YciI family protein [Thiohalomonas denitrificans]|uniref:YciI family protein n=1 Tax=Thiohalomonas denitrificans TaxID=415747 RepID=UPI0026EB862F|nr:YciI family protein [Thiohalomonas denitrificans]